MHTALDTCRPLLVPWARHSPELIHYSNQHKECVLADSLLECVSEGRELLVSKVWVKVHKAESAWNANFEARPLPHHTPRTVLGTL